MSTGTGLLLLAIAFVIAVLIVAVACYQDAHGSPYRRGGPPSPVVRGAALFILATIYNGFWFGLVQLFQAVLGPF